MASFTAIRVGFLLAILGCCAPALVGCGQVGPKQVRVESSAVASTATEGAAIAREFGRGRIPLTFARVQLKKLASNASGPADALGKTAPASGSAGLAANTQALALESQRRLNDLSQHITDLTRRNANYERLTEIAKQASSISDRAEAIE
jgi:methyl-accepting chemotaxis protein